MYILPYLHTSSLPRFLLLFPLFPPPPLPRYLNLNIVLGEAVNSEHKAPPGYRSKI